MVLTVIITVVARKCLELVVIGVLLVLVDELLFLLLHLLLLSLLCLLSLLLFALRLALLGLLGPLLRVLVALEVNHALPVLHVALLVLPSEGAVALLLLTGSLLVTHLARLL